MSIRLRLIDESLAAALARSPEEFERQIGGRMTGVDGIVRDIVVRNLEWIASAPRDLPWHAYLSIDDAAGQIVGTCAFKNGPSPQGDVEIAYFTFPPFEGRGHATAMAQALLRIAIEHATVQRVVAHTLSERNASWRVLEKCGFASSGQVDDPEDGRVARWVHDLLD